MCLSASCEDAIKLSMLSERLDEDVTYDVVGFVDLAHGQRFHQPHVVVGSADSAMYNCDCIWLLSLDLAFLAKF